MAEPASIEFVAAVLTGGASRRMGRNKAAIVIDGTAMAVRVAAAAGEAGAGTVIAVGAPVDGLPHLADDEPGEGPLAGLRTALRFAGDRLVVVLGCDLLHPSAAAIGDAARRLGAAADHDVAVPVVAGREQWLHACWRPATVAPVADAAFGRGERSIHRTVAGLRVLRYDAGDPTPYDDADVPTDLPPPDGS